MKIKTGFSLDLDDGLALAAVICVCVTAVLIAALLTF